MFRITMKGESFDTLYYSLLHFWLYGGSSEGWIRIPSFVFGLCAVITLLALNNRLFGFKTAIVTAVLLGINPFFIQYEQEARPYTLTVFLVVVATYLLVLAVERQSSIRWLTYGTASALSIYARIFSAFAIAAHALSLLIRNRRPRGRDLALGFGLPIVLTGPLLLDALLNRKDRLFLPTLHLGTFTWLFMHLSGGSELGGWSARPLLVWYFAVCSAGMLFVLRSCPPAEWRRDEYWSRWLVLFWLVVPVLGSALMSLISPVLYPRYLIFVLPALVTWAGLCIVWFPHRVLRATALIGLIALTAPAVLQYYSSSVKEGEDWRGAVQYVLTENQPGDGVVFLSRYGRRPFEYYLNRAGSHGGIIPIYPSVAWGMYTPVLGDSTIEPTSAAAERLQAYRRVWTILLWDGFENRHQDGAPLKAVFESRFHEGVTKQFGSNLQVRLYDQLR